MANTQQSILQCKVCGKVFVSPVYSFSPLGYLRLFLAKKRNWRQYVTHMGEEHNMPCAMCKTFSDSDGHCKCSKLAKWSEKH